jgi:hypothetical protein
MRLAAIRAVRGRRLVRFRFTWQSCQLRDYGPVRERLRLTAGRQRPGRANAHDLSQAEKCFRLLASSLIGFVCRNLIPFLLFLFFIRLIVWILSLVVRRAQLVPNWGDIRGLAERV